jgi:hypothetical protein
VPCEPPGNPEGAERDRAGIVAGDWFCPYRALDAVTDDMVTDDTVTDNMVTDNMVTDNMVTDTW